MPAVLAAVLLAVVAGLPAAHTADPLTQALSAAERLQDTSRVLRNGVRSGSPTPVLERLVQQMARDLDELEAAHSQWAPPVPEGARDAVAGEREAIREGCQQMRSQLDAMALALCDDPDGRSRVTSLAIDLARRAGRCEKSTKTIAAMVQRA